MSIYLENSNETYHYNLNIDLQKEAMIQKVIDLTKRKINFRVKFHNSESDIVEEKTEIPQEQIFKQYQQESVFSKLLQGGKQLENFDSEPE